MISLKKFKFHRRLKLKLLLKLNQSILSIENLKVNELKSMNHIINYIKN